MIVSSNEVVKVTQSCPTLATPWTVASKVPLFTGLSRQEYWSGLPFPSPGDLPDPRIEPMSPELQADSLPTELGGKPAACDICSPIRNLTQAPTLGAQSLHHWTLRESLQTFLV